MGGGPVESPAVSNSNSPVDSPLRPYLLPLLIVAAHFIIFAAARAALLLVHRPDFISLSTPDVAWAFVRGLRFDAAVIFTMLGLPLFFLLLPFGWARSRGWRGLWGWVGFASLALFLFILAVNLVYFGYVHRHVGPEVMFLEEAVDQLLLSAVKQYFWALAAFAAALGGLFWAWRRMMRRVPPPLPRRFREGLATSMAALLLMCVAAQGNPFGKRLKVINAFTGVTPPAAYLALNGPFALLHVFGRGRLRNTDFYPWPEAVRTVQDDLLAPNERADDADFPLYRNRPGRAGEKPNVVVIMLESWDAVHTDALRVPAGLPPLGYTPCFDALSREGVLFTRFYACGQKSMDGMSALLCSFPTLPQTPYLGRGMEQSALSFLGNLALREGYETWFLQTSLRDSFRSDVIADLAGFRHYMGAEDIPSVARAGGGRKAVPWDHEMFAEAHRQMAASRRPFFGFLYTTSSHAPYVWPDERWRRNPPDSAEQRYMNSLGYVDWALGRYFAAAKAAPYYAQTVFIVTSDHHSGFSAGLEDLSGMHHVPCLVIAPGLKPSLEARAGGQLDVLPTLIDLAGWGGPYVALGRSLFDESAKADRGAFAVQGDIILRVEGEGWVAHNLQKRVAAVKRTEKADLDGIERRLLSFLQAAVSLLHHNRLCPRR